jgi:hypothetical protein
LTRLKLDSERKVTAATFPMSQEIGDRGLVWLAAERTKGQ